MPSTARVAAATTAYTPRTCMRTIAHNSKPQQQPQHTCMRPLSVLRASMYLRCRNLPTCKWWCDEC